MSGSTAERTSTTMTNAEATTTSETAPLRNSPAEGKAHRQEGCEAGSETRQQEGVQSRPLPRRKPSPPPKGATDRRRASSLGLLRRPKGATMAGVAKATDWQNHSVRCFISGTLSKKMPRGRIHQERGGRADLPDREVGASHPPRRQPQGWQLSCFERVFISTWFLMVSGGGPCAPRSSNRPRRVWLHSRRSRA